MENTRSTSKKSVICRKSTMLLAAIGAVSLLNPLSAVGQVVGVAFTGGTLSNLGVIPPDTNGAVGVNHYVEFVNGRFATYRKSDGVLVSATTDKVRWTSAGLTFGGSDGISDPRSIYDPVSRRWFIGQIDIPSGTGSVANNFLLGVSTGQDPTSAFKAFKIAQGTDFADYPTLGVSGSSVTLFSNNFSTAGSYLARSSMISVPKASLTAAVPSTSGITSILGSSNAITTSTYGVILQPSVDYFHTGNQYLVAQGTTTTTIKVTQLTAGPGSTLVSPTSVAVPAFSAPPSCRQSGTATVIDASDNRIGSSVLRQGNNLWAVQGTNGSSVTGSSCAGIRWYRFAINPGTGAVTLGESGTLADANFDFTYPSIAVNPAGNVVISCTRGGSATFLSSFAITGSYNGTTTSLPGNGAGTVLAAGVGTYTVSGGGRFRWGDYSATTIDPTDPQIFWSAGEYVNSANSYGVRHTELIIPAAGEVRWKSPLSGNATTASAYLQGVAPVSTDRVVFSRATTSGIGSYTVSYSGATTAAQFAIRQGAVNFNLAAASSLTLTDSSAAGSLTVCEYGGDPTATFSGSGVLNTVNTNVAPNTIAIGILNVNGPTWNNSGSVYVGGSSTGAGGAGSLVLSTGNTNIGGSLVVFAADSVAQNSGTVTVTGGVTLASDAGIGTYTLTGGRLVTASIAKGAGSGVFNFSGGTLTASTNTANLFSNFSPTVNAAGAFIDTATFDATIASAINGTGSLTKQGLGTLTLNGANNYGGNTTVSAGTLVLNQPLINTTATLTVADTAAAQLPAGNSGIGTHLTAASVQSIVLAGSGKLSIALTDRTTKGQSVVVTSALAVANDGAPLGTRTYSGQIDVTNNDMVVVGGSLADLSDMARAGQNGPTLFTGNGITSSVAAADASLSLRYAVGVASNNLDGSPLYSLFDGQTVGLNDILVKFTYFGDADLNGIVDDTDFFLLNDGYGTSQTGWVHGDFDYSGVIDDTDYFLINNAYTTQGGGLREGPASVPEPSAPALALLAGALLTRRSRTSR